MHDYSIDGHPKEKILFGLAFAAIWVTPVLNRWAAQIADYFGVALITAIPVFTFYMLVYWFFNAKLWKCLLLRRWLLVPDLNGTWRCLGRRVTKNGQEAPLDWEADVTIVQSWSKISIHLVAARSSSRSVAASIFHEPGAGYKLLYQYQNDPNADEPDLSRHDGAVELLFSDSCERATGHYFTDQHRQTVGTMVLTREKKTNG